MWTFYLFVATISFIYGADNNYQDLGVLLPTPLAEHISAVYNDYLYVFGGINAQYVENTNTIREYNTGFWRLPLGNIELSGTADITGKPTFAEWESLSVTAPAYGPANTNANQFLCEGQCSAVVGQYLYIVGSYTSAGNGFTVTDTVYRLDLSQTPPTFAAEDDFQSTTGYGSDATYGSCVTAINDVLYTVTGVGQGNFVSYIPSSNTQTSLTAYAGTSFFSSRGLAGCAGGNGDANLWLLGGLSTQNTELTYADDYSISGESWTIRNINSKGQFDNGDSTSQRARQKMRCVTTLNNYIECAGGFGSASPKDTAVRYDTTSWDTANSVANSYSDLLFTTFSAGLNSISIFNDGTNAAELMIVTGGYDTAKNQFVPPPSNTTQYAVRYVTLPQPTPSPTKSPSPAPTDETPSPTKGPSRSPLCADCTFPPTGSPTTAAPSTSPVATAGSGVAQICVVFSCILAFISVIII